MPILLRLMPPLLRFAFIMAEIFSPLPAAVFTLSFSLFEFQRPSRLSLLHYPPFHSA